MTRTWKRVRLTLELDALTDGDADAVVQVNPDGLAVGFSDSIGACPAVARSLRVESVTLIEKPSP